MGKRAMTDAAKAIKAQGILDKAAERLCHSEYEKIKMSDIAKEMGMSNGILFVYFKTKESLFFSLLVREYEKRLARLTELAKGATIRTFDDFKQLLIKELLELVDHNPMYIQLESMRAAIFEKNVDAETMLKEKINLYRRMMCFVSIVCENGVLKEADVVDILQAEASIITGCKLSATLPVEVVEMIEANGLQGFKRNFREDVLNMLNCYLDGYERRYKEISTN